MGALSANVCTDARSRRSPRAFSDPFLREAFLAWSSTCPTFRCWALMTTLAWMHNHNAGYPIGGSLEFSRAIERRYLDLGGEIHYKSSREENPGGKQPGGGRAPGRRHATSRRRRHLCRRRARHHLRYAGGQVHQRRDSRLLRSRCPSFAPIIQVSLGVGRDLSSLPHEVTYPSRTSR